MGSKIEKIWQIEIIPETIEEKEKLERFTLLSMYMPSHLKKFQYNFPAFKSLPKEEQVKYVRLFLSEQRNFKRFFHKNIKRRLAALDKLPIKEQIEHYEEKIKEITEGFKIHRLTEILEINESEIETLVEEYRLTREIFEDKLKGLKERKPKEKDYPSHRILVLANWYKNDAGLEKRKTATELRQEGKQQRYDASRELSGLNKKLHKRKDELEYLINFLSEFPQAVALVRKDLDDGNYRK